MRQRLTLLTLVAAVVAALAFPVAANPDPSAAAGLGSPKAGSRRGQREAGTSSQWLFRTVRAE